LAAAITLLINADQAIVRQRLSGNRSWLSNLYRSTSCRNLRLLSIQTSLNANAVGMIEARPDIVMSIQILIVILTLHHLFHRHYYHVQVDIHDFHQLLLTPEQTRRYLPQNGFKCLFIIFQIMCIEPVDPVISWWTTSSSSNQRPFNSRTVFNSGTSPEAGRLVGRKRYCQEMS
jgi:hypothetical protein